MTDRALDYLIYEFKLNYVNKQVILAFEKEMNFPIRNKSKSIQVLINLKI